jgi:hypothetical protein
MERTRLYYQAHGFTRDYGWAEFEDVPFTPLRKPLAESTVALMSTASLYNRVATDRREVASGLTLEPPPRLYANDLSWDKQATHLDDLNSYFPIDRLSALAARGRIGRLAEHFHCLPTSYSRRGTLEDIAPEVLRRCRQDNVDIALLVPL